MQQRLLTDPVLHVVLYQPEIPANTGNIARLCGATGSRLHLIHPLGFSLEDKYLKRAGLDYWDQVDVREHVDLTALEKEINKQKTAKMMAFSSHADEIYVDAQVNPGDYLLFGPESCGLLPPIRQAYPCYRIPIWGSVRSLNLSTTVGIVVYQYLHQMGKF